MNNNLTLDSITKFIEAVEKALKPLLYVSYELCERDKIIFIGPKWSPEYIVFHPLDFDKVNKFAFENGYKLVEIKNYMPEFLTDKELGNESNENW